MFEHRTEPILPRAAFVRRVLRHIGLGVVIVLASLLVGTIGYRTAEHWSWTDATLNAAMILSGMGPVDEVQSEGGKVFATVYALYSGLVVIGLMAVVLLPFMHRLMHRFHLEVDVPDGSSRENGRTPPD
jgi:hypothetical protein